MPRASEHLPGGAAEAPSSVDLERAAAELAGHARAHAARWDQDGGLPASVRKEVAASGLLAADLPGRYGGAGLSPLALGEITARIGAECGALRGLLTVQGMVAAALLRWGTGAQRAEWLPALAAGELVAGFAATEEGAGSALGAMEARIEAPNPRELVVSGRKRWVTFGAVADVFLVLGLYEGRPAAVLVDADRASVRREPVNGQLGMRGALIAHLALDRVRVPRDRLVAPPGLGISHVAGTALDHGRFTVAWGCVGMAEACVEDAAGHAAVRRQGGGVLGDHPSVRSLLARAAVDAAGARQLARVAAEARAAGPGHGLPETLMAKYAAASAAAAVSRAAVQVLGSAGCAPDSRAGRHFRDAKVMEIIEGAQEVTEQHIAERLLRLHTDTAHGTTPSTGGPA
ncbi:acyl-CoA dehydrogenase family protein [Streptomyces sp. NPDC015131]|uniref:acyl-CoA dehydrogenase family protein n=1 Tax=Streptomyces sp. NPDC015131 TaxID=3364941 RepID=UPI0036FF7C72